MPGLHGLLRLPPMFQECHGSAPSSIDPRRRPGVPIVARSRNKKNQRFRMTTSTTTRPESAGISWGPVLWVSGLHLGALLAFVPAYFTWQALAVCVFLHWLTGGIGICMTYHRLLVHRSFTVRYKWMEYVLTAIGCSASEGGAIGWVSDHRRHHAHSDEEDDAHSPNRGL